MEDASLDQLERAISASAATAQQRQQESDRLHEHAHSHGWELRPQLVRGEVLLLCACSGPCRKHIATIYVNKNILMDTDVW